LWKARFVSGAATETLPLRACRTVSRVTSAPHPFKRRTPRARRIGSARGFAGIALRLSDGRTGASPRWSARPRFLAALAGLAIDNVQGYGISRPAPIEDLVSAQVFAASE
jgi:hypothetical protein